MTWMKLLEEIIVEKKLGKSHNEMGISLASFGNGMIETCRALSKERPVIKKLQRGHIYPLPTHFISGHSSLHAKCAKNYDG